MLCFVEDDAVVSEWLKLLLSEKYEFEFLNFRQIQLDVEEFTLKKNEIVVDISRNPNYLLVINRLKKLLGCLQQVHFIINSEQYQSLKNTAEIADNMFVMRSVLDLESYFSSKFNYYRRRL